MARVVLAMSGGVDSSTAAHLLLEAGHEVVGVFMRHGEESTAACAVEGGESLPVLGSRADHKQGCCSASDARDARRVADSLRIPFYALDLQSDFRRIVDYFVDAYTRGRTPNPCVQCNNWIKFGRLFDYADSIDAQFVATGHYARLEHLPHDPTPALRSGVDASKDQSYALFGIRRQMLPRMMLPVGGYDKKTIREIAGRLGLNVAEKKDSQEICFVTSGDHDQFVKARAPQAAGRNGAIVTTDGREVGRHEGIEKFTVGQRKGLGVALGTPQFVVRIEPETHQVVIGPKTALARPTLSASGLNWLVDPPQGEFACEAKIRYNGRALAAKAEIVDHDRLDVRFTDPAEGVAPGQAVVLYQEDRVLGGGWIE